MQLGLPFASVDAAPDSPRPAPPEAPPTASIQFYFVRHHRARRYLLRVEPDGRVRVTIPRGGSRREADAFAARHREWVTRQQARLSSIAIPTSEERRAWMQQARLELPARLMELATAHGVPVSRVSVRNQRSRWGSCGRDGHICLNWRLVRMPAWVRDYVMVHELMHLIRMDHSPQYWALVADACPEYEQARQWLRANGRGL
jgi:predicted metal-dependent hydrolase